MNKSYIAVPIILIGVALVAGAGAMKIRAKGIETLEAGVGDPSPTQLNLKPGESGTVVYDQIGGRGDEVVKNVTFEGAPEGASFETYPTPEFAWFDYRSFEVTVQLSDSTQPGDYSIMPQLKCDDGYSQSEEFLLSVSGTREKRDITFKVNDANNPYHKITVGYDTGRANFTVQNQETKSIYEGTALSVSASKWDWSHWSGYFSGNSSVKEFHVPSKDITIVANFGESDGGGENYGLRVTTTKGGTVSFDPETSDNFYEEGTGVTITAQPEEGYVFSKWTGGLSGSENPKTITMNADIDAEAVFEDNEGGGEEYALTLSTEPGKGGSVTTNAETSTFNDGESVQLTAHPNEGYEFSEWTGDAAGTEKSITIVMTEDKTVTAEFSEEPIAPAGLDIYMVILAMGIVLTVSGVLILAVGGRKA